MKIIVAQMNPIIGDLVGNAREIIKISKLYEDADLIVFPEMALTGYPPKDLIRRNDMLKGIDETLNQITQSVTNALLVGAGVREAGSDIPFNAAVLCKDGSWSVVAKKILLPNYNVFDDKRYFRTPNETACSVISFLGKKLLLSICEDAWAGLPGLVETQYDFDPIANAVKQNGRPDIIINMSASPYSKTKPKRREEVFTHIARTYQAPVLMCGQVGANDQLLFDGHSMIIDSHGVIVSSAKSCLPDQLIFDSEHPTKYNERRRNSTDEELLLEVLCMGIRDYLKKCGAPGAVIGISGGIDSAVCAALLTRALGKDRVRALYLPSRFSSEQSRHDAHLLAKNLSIRLDTIPIEDGLNGIRSLLGDKKLTLRPDQGDIVDQNLQSRLRGLLIMGLSNATDFLMVTTSNKSELAVGYATIYGDLCGAFSPLGDVYKTDVYCMAKQINNKSGFDLIPKNTIERSPSAELKANQFDTDSLPDYDVLDKILFNFIDLEKSAGEIETHFGFPRDLIDSVINLVNRAEYKRRQGPFPLMVSDKVFGDARRLPMAKRVPTFA